MVVQQYQRSKDKEKEEEEIDQRHSKPRTIIQPMDHLIPSCAQSHQPSFYKTPPDSLLLQRPRCSTHRWKYSRSRTRERSSPAPMLRPALWKYSRVRGMPHTCCCRLRTYAVASECAFDPPWWPLLETPECWSPVLTIGLASMSLA